MSNLLKYTIIYRRRFQAVVNTFITDDYKLAQDTLANLKFIECEIIDSYNI